MAVEVYKDKNSPYWYFQIPVLDARGNVTKYQRGSTKRRDYGEARLVAREKARELLDRLQRGVKEDQSLFSVIDEHVKMTEAQKKSDFKNQNVFRSYVEPLCAKSHLMTSQFDRSLIERWKVSFIKEGYSPSYVNNFLTFLVTVYNQAVRLGYDVPSNQKFDGLQLAVKVKTRYLLDGEEEKLLAELDPPREKVNGMTYEQRKHLTLQRRLGEQHDLVGLLIDTGVRHTEATETPWATVDTVTWDSINFYRQKVGNEGTIRLTKRVSEMLQRRHKLYGNSPYIFPSHIEPTRPRGSAMRGVRNAIKRADLNADHLVKRYGKFTPHCFRHTFASRLVQGGMSLYAVGQLLGHADEQMTKRYAHLQRHDIANQAVELLERR